MKPLFAILPYIKTEQPFYVARIPFRGSRDVEGLTPEEVDHLSSITKLFYLTDSESIDEFVYVLLHLPDNREQSNEQVRKLRAAHTILTFLVTQDYLYDTFEQLTIYVMIPTEVLVFGESSASLVPGYSVTINWRHWCEIARDQGLYPPQPYPRALLPKGGHLSDLRWLWGSDVLFRGFEEFIQGNLLGQPEQSDRFETILRAMSWYNRSFSKFDSEEERVVHLAVAFETLFHKGDSSLAIKEELKTHLRGLFGEAKRLTNWVEQFYDARSKILHEGFSTRLNFVVGDKQPTEQQLVMDSLVNYGRRLLRMCILNILHGTLLAESVNLNAWFTHNRERLQEICKRLRDEAILAEQRLLSVVNLVYDLEEYWSIDSGQRDVEMKTIHAAGKMLIQAYLEAYPETEGAIRQQLEHTVNAESDTPRDLVDAYSKLADELSRGLAIYKGKYWPRQPRQALAHFAKYASSILHTKYVETMMSSGL